MRAFPPYWRPKRRLGRRTCCWVCDLRTWIQPAKIQNAKHVTSRCLGSILRQLWLHRGRDDLPHVERRPTSTHTRQNQRVRMPRDKSPWSCAPGRLYFEVPCVHRSQHVGLSHGRGAIMRVVERLARNVRYASDGARNAKHSTCLTSMDSPSKHV